MTRTFKVTIPESVVEYAVDDEVLFRQVEEDGSEPSEDYLRYKVGDDAVAAIELGSFGDPYLGIAFIGGVVNGEVSVKEVK